LFAVRLASQFGDGVFQVALASFVLCSPEHAPSAGAIAVGLAVLLLPYSIVGPFAGVLLDRLNRKHVLIACDLIRAEALIRIDCEAPLPCGLLALGQRAELSLDARHGSELLMFLGRSLAAMIRRWLTLPHN
jgi:MFS family permease